ncbi:hypothetical protein SAMN05216312_110125 [Cohnella sp. OV330]|uniref:hypothetical protein n=1 Tax=Cohnella sp. OV330 TaxID=1855288 RepID=UPI0008EFD469|nr:hypothetical protein [Cohnella sp. OV330]SFB49677.1 hypothetical protein SAMN05216312_110125 [Cohnella sp. OV330]
MGQTSEKAALKRVTLEMSLKPFTSMEPAAIDEVCEEAIRQWLPLIGLADRCSMLLWVADGSEILTWNGNFDSAFEWGRYIGFANEDKFSHIKSENDAAVAKLYRDDPCRVTYGDLRYIVAAFKRIAGQKFGIRMEVGATFDAGPEFAYSDFKYKDHPEINKPELGGKFVALRADYTVVCVWSKLHGDKAAYATYPDGIPEDTPFGQFFGRQCASYLPALGFDYIWFSNGFGFSSFPWTYLGANFDGTSLPLAEYEELSGKLLSFWEAFKQECPGYRTEVRGTNFGTGMDLTKDFVPLKQLYEAGYIELPPPNSPWGALNFDFGLEVASYMSRIAVLPGDTYPYRFYANDPWFWQNPWRDLYDREPHDIYCPLSVARMNADGKLENPGIVEILTIDTEKGKLIESCPQEVIPHLRRAIEDFPDEPGILTWLYPFHEYHAAVADSEERSKSILFEEWFVRNAVNEGLPLNTVLSTDSFREMREDNRRKLHRTVIFTPTSWIDAANASLLADYVRGGGQVLFYGPALAPGLQQLLNIRQAEGLEGELDVSVSASLAQDAIFGERPSPSVIDHDPLIGGGAIGEVLADANDRATQVCATAKQDGRERVMALTRRPPEWNGGQAGWVRGSLPFLRGSVTDLPVRQPQRYLDVSVQARYVLAQFGYSLLQTKQDAASKSALLFIARRDNGYFFTGCRQDTSVSLQMRFPQGVPILIGQTTKVGEGPSAYSLDRTFHDECRLFVRQSSGSLVSCREHSPMPTPNRSSTRLITVAGLREASLTIYPPLDALREARVEVKCGDVYLELPDYTSSDCIIIDNLDGALEISW